MGTEIQATINITLSVIWLDVASQTVKLASGIVMLGIRNGNIEKPAVKITPAINSAAESNASDPTVTIDPSFKAIVTDKTL